VEPRKILTLGFFIVLIIGVIASVFFLNKPQTLKRRASETKLSSLTTQLVQIASQQTLRDDPGKLTEATLIAKERKQLMIEAAEKNPQEFLDNALTSEEQQQIPTELKDAGLVEQDKIVNGTLRIRHYEIEAQRLTGVNVYSITDKNNMQYILYFTSPPQITDKSTVEIKGVALDTYLVTIPKNVDVLTLAELPQIDKIVGTQKTLAILFNFTNAQHTTLTKSKVEQDMTLAQQSANNFMKETSYNTVSLATDVVGPYTIPTTNSNCKYNDWNWADLADNEARKAGIPVDSYKYVLYIFPNTYDCWGVAWAEGIVARRSWYNGSFYWNYAAHELGHDFGVNHSSSIDCNGKLIDSYAACEAIEYGDYYDTMGSGTNHYNASLKDKLGWLPDNRLQEATTDGTYSIVPLETSTLPGIQALKIKKPDTDQYYYLEYRQPTGFDSNIKPIITNGALIHTPEGSINRSYIGSLLLDATPETKFLEDEAMSDGRSVQDTINNIQITQLAHSGSSVTLAVKFGGSISPTGISPTGTNCGYKSQGDANCDGKIDIIDFAVWRGVFASDGYDLTVDFNQDKLVNIIDFAVWRNGYVTLNP
jgi:hypothetical protein